MLSRISRGKSGLCDYLENGQKKDSIYTRDQKDKVVSIYGDLSVNKKCEDFLNKEKNFAHNYTHITLSFSEADQIKMEKMTDDERSEFLYNLTEDYIKHHTSGHDLKNEVIAYAELHQPKIKYENGKMRFPHIHIMIMNYNPVANTALRTTFRTNDFIDNTLQTWACKKYGLEVPVRNRERTGETEMAISRKELVELLQDVKGFAELRAVLKDNGLEWREEVGKDKYFKVLNKKGNDINLRGKGFEHISEISKDKGMHLNKSRTEGELAKILNGFYERQVEKIDGRRSAKTKEAMQTLHTSVNPSIKVDSIELSYQQKIFKSLYKKVSESDLKGYYIDTSNKNATVFTNKKKSIKVVDRGDKITSDIQNANQEEKVKLMLDIAEAKGWNLATISINGNEAFKKEARRQIVKRLKLDTKTLSLTEAVAIKEQTKKPKSPVAEQKREDENQKVKSAESLKDLKENLKASSVLAYAVKHFKLDVSQYEVTADNKIKNLNSKKKPKNVIDFLGREIGMTSKEAIAIVKELYSQQPMPVKTAELPTPVVQVSKSKQRKSNEYSKQQRARALSKSISGENGREEQTPNDLHRVSDIVMVHSRGKQSEFRSPMLLSENERNNLRKEREADKRVRHARARDTQTPIKSRTDGELEMPLFISITDDKSVVKKPSGKLQMTALNGWRVKEVSNYNDLSLLMKNYSYASSRFDGRRHQDNAKTFNNMLIFDIDNDPDDKQITLKEAKALLESKGISAMLMPSKSHQIEKFTDSGKSKGIKDRYRIVIPTKTAIRNSTDKDTYKEFQRLAVQSLGLTGAVDKGALTDSARFYQQSLQTAVRTIAEGKVIDTSNWENKAIENISQARAEKEAQRLKIDELRANIRKYRAVTNDTASNYLNYVDAVEIMDIPINMLIMKFEGGKEDTEGSYKYIKTDATKYSIIDDKLAHDFKNDMTYNSLTYLQMQFETTNLNTIARSLEKAIGENYLRVNTEAVKTAIDQSLKDATNDKSFEANIKEYFSVKFVKLEKDSIKIADQQISLKDVGTDKGAIVNTLKDNRQQEAVKKAEVMKTKEVKKEDIKSKLEHKKEPKEQGQLQGRGGISR